MTLPRNRRIRSFKDIDCGQTRFDNPTSNPLFRKANRARRASARVGAEI
jgi:hypothetical protein